jgi:hypothetical protein
MSALPLSMSLNSTLWNFLAPRVDGRAGEGGIEGRLARQLVAVAHQLQVQLRRHRRGAGVHHLVLHGHVVGAALQRVGLDQLHAALHRRLELHHQLVGAVLQRAVAAEGHHRLVRREVAADQAALRQVDALGALVHQHERRLRRRGARREEGGLMSVIDLPLVP